jgi:hypothetical protein
LQIAIVEELSAGTINVLNGAADYSHFLSVAGDGSDNGN